MEQWKDVPGYEGLYAVSSLGRIKSLPRIVECIRKGGTIKKQVVKEAIIGSTKGRYGKVSLIKNKIASICIPHRIVAAAFLPQPPNKPQVNHINGNKHDNRVENLEWCDAFENMQHAVRTGLMKPQDGERNNGARLSDTDVKEIRRLKSETSITNTELSKRFMVNNSTIGYVVKGKTWAHIV